MTTATILFAGGGTGGHIYPNVAIAERLLEHSAELKPHFLVSNRTGDRQILERLGYSYSASPVQPLPPLSRPWRLLPFFLAWRRAVREARQLLAEQEIAAVIATGGFVSGPAVVAASKRGIPPCALVNLDAIPGVANRRLARYKSEIFTVYDSPVLPGATRIGLPLRRASLFDGESGDGPDAVEAARAELSLQPDKPVLFITGATHGAESIIRAMIALIGSDARGFESWQVFHQCGTFDPAELQKAYDDAGIPARVAPYCDHMGAAWRAASLAISRAGAGSVAEAWANATPTLFLPNPYHRDQHQKHNAQPVVDAGGALMIADRIDPQANMPALRSALESLMGDPGKLEAMRESLVATRPPDGAAAIAKWVKEQI